MGRVNVWYALIYWKYRDMGESMYVKWCVVVEPRCRGFMRLLELERGASCVKQGLGLML
jgi:hypothetical protein